MTADMYYDYLTAYMAYGGVDEKKHFKLNTIIDKMAKTEEGDWNITYTDQLANKTVTQKYDWVFVCTGQHQVSKEDIKMGTFPGLENFKGDIMHSSNYVNAKPFVNKKVLIIGGGDSGADIVKHIADICSPGHCYMSLRKGAHVAPRYFYGDSLPIDYAMFRFAYYMPHLLRTNILRQAFHKVMDKAAETCPTSAQILRLHKLNGLSASTYFTTKSEEMCKAFAAGTAQLKPEVKTFTETGVIFGKPSDKIEGINGDPVEIDSLILCTGFKTVYPFLPQEFREHQHLDRYRLVVHPGLDQVAFIGFARPTGFGAIPPCAEMQARWISQVVSGKVDLPSKKHMIETASVIKTNYLKVRKVPNQMLVFFPYYLAEIAHEFGVNPRPVQLFLKSPTLWFKVMFGVYNATQYRLNGPNADFEKASSHIVNNMPYPNPIHGPVKRPPIPILLASSIIFGIISKVPFLGQPFSACV